MTLCAALRTRLSPSFTLDVDLDVADGITIVFGASGSGKSTLLRCLAGLTRPDEGRIQIGGTTVFDSATAIDRPPRERRIGFVFQHLALFPHLTVARNIAYGLAHLSTAEQAARVDTMARAFHIDNLLARRPEQLSGGERQRAALARTLVTEPALLLLDEPLAALDYRIQEQIIHDLRSWNATRRIPVLYVTHSHREVYALGERVIVMRDGHVAADGTPHQVMEHPTRDELAQLAGFENMLPGHVLDSDAEAGITRIGFETGDRLEVPIASRPAGEPVTIAIRAGDVMLGSEPPRGLSASNVLPGRVAAITRIGPVVRVTVISELGTPFVADLTPRGASALGLVAGGQVWLIVKAYSCRIAAR